MGLASVLMDTVETLAPHIWGYLGLRGARPGRRLPQLLLPLPVQQGAADWWKNMCARMCFAPTAMNLAIASSGPPGNGKTSFAEAIAEALVLPFFVVRYDALIGSYLGETNARLRTLFDYVRTRPSVLFFDEFDAIGKERGDTHETGEIKRVVSFLPPRGAFRRWARSVYACRIHVESKPHDRLSKRRTE